MKEATGELNMTVITVVAIAAVAAFFYAFVWPSIKKTIQRNQQCSSATACSCNGDTCQCKYITDEGTISTDTISCPNPDAKPSTGG